MAAPSHRPFSVAVLRQQAIYALELARLARTIQQKGLHDCAALVWVEAEQCYRLILVCIADLSHRFDHIGFVFAAPGLGVEPGQRLR